MKRLKIAHKLGLASLLFLVPVAYMVWALVASQNIAIDFGRKEEAGTFYLRGLAAEQMALARGRAAGGPAADAAAAGRIAALETAYGPGMESAELAAAATQAFAALAATPGPDAPEAARTALRALIGRVGDKSNLILDPDLDSYYVMDLILLKLPDTLDRAAAMGVLSRAVWADGALGTDEQVDFYVALGALTTLVDGIEASVASGYSGNADGSLKANLDASYAAASQALRAMAAAVEKGAVDEAGTARLLEAVDGFYSTASAEMERLLERRIDGFLSEQQLTLAITAVLFLLAIAAVLAIVRISVIGRLRRLTTATTALAGGDLAVALAADGSVDEVADMVRAVQVFKDSMIHARAVEAQQAEERAQRDARTRRIEALTQRFEAAAGAVVGTLSSAAHEMQATAQSMTTTAEETSRQSATVASASEQASMNVQTVASATEELTSSLAEINRQVGTSSTIAGKAVGEAGKANALVKGLAEAAQKIGAVTSLINEIASQTNLLALNATIEAARAGEAGKGFAVVASEVKSLANQTAKATEEIGAQIAAMQGATGQTVDAIGGIGATIAQMNQIAAAIAAAVEEQGAATQEIARNVQQAAAGTQEVSGNIVGVTQAASETGAAATQVLGTAGELARQAEQLRSEVEAFLAEVKVA